MTDCPPTVTSPEVAYFAATGGGGGELIEAADCQAVEQLRSAGELSVGSVYRFPINLTPTFSGRGYSRALAPDRLSPITEFEPDSRAGELWVGKIGAGCQFVEMRDTSENTVLGAGGVAQFPWGDPQVLGNYLDHAVLNYAGQSFMYNRLGPGSYVSLSAGGAFNTVFGRGAGFTASGEVSMDSVTIGSRTNFQVGGIGSFHAQFAEIGAGSQFIIDGPFSISASVFKQVSVQCSGQLHIVGSHIGAASIINTLAAAFQIMSCDFTGMTAINASAAVQKCNMTGVSAHDTTFNLSQGHIDLNKSRFFESIVALNAAPPGSYTGSAAPVLVTESDFFSSQFSATGSETVVKVSKSRFGADSRTVLSGKAEINEATSDGVILIDGDGATLNNVDLDNNRSINLNGGSALTLTDIRSSGTISATGGTGLIKDLTLSSATLLATNFSGQLLRCNFMSGHIVNVVDKTAVYQNLQGAGSYTSVMPAGNLVGGAVRNW